VVDDVPVLRLLPSITDGLAVLRREADASVERRADPLWLRAVKYTFVTAIEAAIVVDALNDPSDLDDFVRRVSRWLEDQL
jgi:hypothetical protein